jgi:hypothetical protein
MTVRTKYEPLLAVLFSPFEMAEINSKTGKGKGKAIPVQMVLGGGRSQISR